MVGRDVSTIYPPAEGKPGNTVLSLRGVGCHASAVHDINLDIRTGEVLGLAGMMGAGRTELARTLFGITPADSGTIVLDGRERCISSPREAVEAGIGYVPEDRRRHGIILEMPVAANITMGIHPRLFPGSWLRIDRERQLASITFATSPSKRLPPKTRPPISPAAINKRSRSPAGSPPSRRC